MSTIRPFSEILNRLRSAGLRPTRQRLALGRALFEGGNRHVTAETLHNEAVRANIPVSLATVYNALNRFTNAGMLREITVGPGKSFFDTNVTEHHHIYYEDEGRLEDIPAGEIGIEKPPPVRAGYTLSRIDVVIRMATEKN